MRQPPGRPPHRPRGLGWPGEPRAGLAGGAAGWAGRGSSLLGWPGEPRAGLAGGAARWVGRGELPAGLAGGLACHAAEVYCRYVIAAIGAAGATLFIMAALAWTARLVHVGNLDALALAQKVGTPYPVSAVDWPELHVCTVVSVTDEPPVVLLLVEWPAHREQAAASLLVRLDDGDQRSVPLLSQWCAIRASVSPTRREDGRLELRRRQSMERVRGFLVAEDPQRAPSAAPRAGARRHGRA
jgi:hypothetical protein